jgi:multicomponent Na+:H+ antiporter subunit G
MVELIGIIEVIVAILLAGGLFYMFTGAIGLLRFPDFYTRLHATGKCDTLGEILIIVGLLVYHVFVYSPGADISVKLVPVKLLFLIMFLLLTNPVGTHALMKAGYTTGVKPWKIGDKRM